MPDKESERPDIVVITGLEQNAVAARDDILRIVHDFVSSIIITGANCYNYVSCVKHYTDLHDHLSCTPISHLYQGGS